MKLRNLFEAPRKVAVAAFGRMNPPTIGHEKLVDKIKSVDGDHYVFLSQTQKPKTDPLPFDAKLEFAKKFFPGVNVGHPSVRTPIQMLQMLEKLGYTDVIYVAGSDRVESFTKLFNDYNGKEYNFDSIEVVSAGERDPDADGAEGMSASKMRAAAASGDYESFALGTPDAKLAQKMYDAVRTGMGVKDTVSKEESELGDLAHQTTLKHRFLVTYSDPNHTMVTKRKERLQKHVLAPSTNKNGESVFKGDVEPLVKKHMTKQGFRVHEIEHVGMISVKANKASADQPAAGENKFNYKQDNWSQDFERRMKQGVAEDHVDESKGSKVVQNLVDKFYDDNEIEWSDGNIYVKDPGTRVWTRGDGTRYRDPGKIRAKDDRDAKQLKAFFSWLIKQPGVKHLGKLSGSFASEEPGDVYATGGIYFKLMNHGIIEWGSVSRFKNPRSVWKQQPKSADVEEDQVDELSSALLGRYKKGASAAATAADKKGDYKQGDKRYSGIIKATKKQFANDKKVKEGLGDVEFDVDGWKYRAEEEDEGDVLKLYHSATSPEGKTVDIDFSPYEAMTPELFKLWAKLGMPKRQGSGPLNKETLLKMAQAGGVKEASYEGNIGIMELFKFFSKAEKEDPKLVARVKEMIKQRRDKEVWRIIQDYTGTQLTGKEFEGSIKEAIFKEAGHGKYWCSTDKKWKFRKGPKKSRGS